MASDQPRWLRLSARLADRLAFLRDENSPTGMSVPCRLPGCREVTPRKAGQGRTPWFHDKRCAKVAHRRRIALDEAIAELAEQYYRNNAKWRERSAIAWDARWLLGRGSLIQRCWADLLLTCPESANSPMVSGSGSSR